MPLNVFWDDEAKTIIRSEGVGAWTWDEFHESLEKIVDMAQTVEHRIDLIHFPQPGSHVPPGSGVPHYQRAMRTMPPNVGLNIFINANTFGRMIISIFMNVYGSGQTNGKLAAVASLEDAYKLIRKDRKEEVPNER